MKSFFLLGLPLALAVWIFSGCVTPSVPVTYTEPARLNMSGISRIVINSNDTQVASEISRRLTVTGKYTIAPASELQTRPRWEAEQQTKMRQWEAAQRNAEAEAAYIASAIEIRPAALVEAYTANAARADSSYNGKLLKTSGVVKEIGVTSRGRYFVRLGVGNDAVDVYFVPSETNKLMSVDKGKTITVIGKCTGFNPPTTDDTAEILRILGAGRSVNINEAKFPYDVIFPIRPQFEDYSGPTVDAVISLTKDISSEDRYMTVKEKQAVGQDEKGFTKYEEVDVTYYYREATVNLNYKIERTRDGSVIGQGTKSETLKSYVSKDQSNLPSVSELASKIIDRPIKKLAGEMVPTEQTTNIRLIKEKNNKEAKKEMGEAEKLVKAGNFKPAAEAYGKIYAKYKNFAAGYNQAVLTEGIEGTVVAIGLMEALVNQTNETLARSTLADMQKRNEGNQRAAQQLSR